MKRISVTPTTTTTTMQSQTQTQTQAPAYSEYWAATAMAATPKTKTKTPATLYSDDGSMYTGHVNECGAKHGQGTLKTAMYLYGCMGDDNSHVLRWTEYTGHWSDGLLHGQGIMRHMSSNEVMEVVHDGMWSNGVPI